MLERFGIVSPLQIEDVTAEQDACPSKDTGDILLEKGYATQTQIDVADKTPSDPNGLVREPTTGEYAVLQLKKAKACMDETITQGTRLSDVAAAIAAKKVKS
jgi:hypothetical protein